jgi:hypothetical protein
MNIDKEIKKVKKLFRSVGITSSAKDFYMMKLEVLMYLKDLKNNNI